MRKDRLTEFIFNVIFYFAVFSIARGIIDVVASKNPLDSFGNSVSMFLRISFSILFAIIRPIITTKETNDQ